MAESNEKSEEVRGPKSEREKENEDGERGRARPRMRLGLRNLLAGGGG